MYRASKVQKSKNRFVRADVLFAELASDFGGELVVGGGPFREPPTVMQSTVIKQLFAEPPSNPSPNCEHLRIEHVSFLTQHQRIDGHLWCTARVFRTVISVDFQKREPRI